MTKVASIAKQRVAKGLCPQCGAEAAPYYLCERCRSIKRLGRMLDRMADAGGIDRVRMGPNQGRVGYAPSSVPEPERKKIQWREVSETDRRWAPRIKNLPVDVERELIAMFECAGDPLRIDEILAAWGTLRLRKERASAAHDLRAIILAERKRRRKGQAAQRQVA